MIRADVLSQRTRNVESNQILEMKVAKKADPAMTEAPMTTASSQYRRATNIPTRGSIDSVYTLKSTDATWPVMMYGFCTAIAMAFMLTAIHAVTML